MQQFQDDIELSFNTCNSQNNEQTQPDQFNQKQSLSFSNYADQKITKMSQIDIENNAENQKMPNFLQENQHNNNLQKDQIQLQFNNNNNNLILNMDSKTSHQEKSENSNQSNESENLEIMSQSQQSQPQLQLECQQRQQQMQIQQSPYRENFRFISRFNRHAQSYYSKYIACFVIFILDAVSLYLLNDYNMISRKTFLICFLSSLLLLFLLMLPQVMQCVCSMLYCLFRCAGGILKSIWNGRWEMSHLMENDNTTSTNSSDIEQSNQLEEERADQIRMGRDIVLAAQQQQQQQQEQLQQLQQNNAPQSQNRLERYFQRNDRFLQRHPSFPHDDESDANQNQNNQHRQLRTNLPQQRLHFMLDMVHLMSRRGQGADHIGNFRQLQALNELQQIISHFGQFQFNIPMQEQHGVQQEMIDNLPLFIFDAQCAQERTQKSEQEKGDDCVICLMDFEEGDKIITLPCVHNFHQGCIVKWLSNNTSCPLCKQVISVQ